MIVTVWLMQFTMISGLREGDPHTLGTAEGLEKSLFGNVIFNVREREGESYTE